MIRQWQKTLNSLRIDSYEIWAINDGSKDTTAKILDKLISENKTLKVFHQENLGHGSTLHAYYNFAVIRDADYIFQVDSDDQFDSLDFKTFWRDRKHFDVIQANRKFRNDPFYRIALSWMMVKVINILFKIKVVDPNVPFRLYKKSALKELLPNLSENYFAPNMILSILTRKANLNIDVRNTSHKRRNTGKVSLPPVKLINICIWCLIDLFELRKNTTKKLAVKDEKLLRP